MIGSALWWASCCSASAAALASLKGLCTGSQLLSAYVYFTALCSPDPDCCEQVEAFRFKDDQKRALVSRLLQRQCVSAAMSLSWESVQIKRTKGRKPFVMNKTMDRSGAPNFNFNVSHEVCTAPQISSLSNSRALILSSWVLQALTFLQACL